MDSNYHVTFLVCQDGIRVSCCVVEEPFDEEDSVCGGFSLGSG